MTEKPKAQPVKLFITSCSSVYSGTNKRGDDYQIFEVQANFENGQPITDKKLRSFEDLPTGELLDLTVTKFESEQHGVSFTLARKGSSSHKRIDALEQRVTRLEQAAQHGSALDDRFGSEPPY